MGQRHNPSDAEDVMHPSNPIVDGRVLDDPKFDCAQGVGKNLFVAFVDVCEKSGDGFVNYLWPKPSKDGLTIDQPKLSYVRGIPEWGWVVGTGVYVDDALEDAKRRRRPTWRVCATQRGWGTSGSTTWERLFREWLCIPPSLPWTER